MISVVRHHEGRPLSDPDHTTMNYLFNITKAAGLKTQGSTDRFEAEDAQGNIYVFEVKEGLVKA